MNISRQCLRCFGDSLLEMCMVNFLFVFVPFQSLLVGVSYFVNSFFFSTDYFIVMFIGQPTNAFSWCKSIFRSRRPLVHQFRASARLVSRPVWSQSPLISVYPGESPDTRSAGCAQRPPQRWGLPVPWSTPFPIPTNSIIKLFFSIHTCVYAMSYFSFRSSNAWHSQLLQRYFIIKKNILASFMQVLSDKKDNI